ncbi:MAG TPA: hypothetical protein VGG98_07720 [Solirubrobacteraceae bacterium]|jgi:hypothetical protein
MSDASNGSRDTSVPREDSSVLGNLPRTRPQRASARRAAARRGTKAAAAKTTVATVTPAKPMTKRPERPAKKAARAPASKNVSHAAASAKRAPRSAKRAPSTGRVAEAVPRQGFETEGEIGSGSVQPPGGTELVAAAAEIVGELTKAGLSAGERLMRDVLSRLPLS